MDRTTFREGHDGSLACKHRDCSVCPDCAKHPNVGDVVGQHYWFHDPIDAADADAESAAYYAEAKQRQADRAAAMAGQDHGEFWRVRIAEIRQLEPQDPGRILWRLLSGPPCTQIRGFHADNGQPYTERLLELTRDDFWNDIAAFVDVEGLLAHLEET